jgi:uncharacterized membrane protein YfcA
MVFLGGAVGLFSTALGQGGGIVMVPAFFQFVPGMDINTAKGTSLFIIMFVAAINALRMNGAHMAEHLRLGAVIAIGSIVGGYLGAWGTSLMSDEVVIWVFVLLLGFAGLRTFFLKERRVLEGEVRKRLVFAILIGFAAGIVGGATGTGGGAILVPLSLWAGIVSNERVVALSNTVMVATCASGALAHALAEKTTTFDYTVGQVDFALAPLVFIGAQLARPLGRRINAWLTLPRRRFAMGTVLVVITLRLMMEVI